MRGLGSQGEPVLCQPRHWAARYGLTRAGLSATGPHQPNWRLREKWPIFEHARLKITAVQIHLRTPFRRKLFPAV